MDKIHMQSGFPTPRFQASYFAQHGVAAGDLDTLALKRLARRLEELGITEERRRNAVRRPLCAKHKLHWIGP
jgi:hypothetical protein